MVHVLSTMWRIKNEPSNCTSCSHNVLRLLVLVAGRLHWGPSSNVSKGCFERGIFWRAKSRLKGIDDSNLEHWPHSLISLLRKSSSGDTYRLRLQPNLATDDEDHCRKKWVTAQFESLFMESNETGVFRTYKEIISWWTVDYNPKPCDLQPLSRADETWQILAL